jgi:hypothetical protein
MQIALKISQEISAAKALILGRLLSLHSEGRSRLTAARSAPIGCHVEVGLQLWLCQNDLRNRAMEAKNVKKVYCGAKNVSELRQLGKQRL